MLTVSLNCPFLIAPSVLFCLSSSCVPNVDSFSELSVFDCPSVFPNVYVLFQSTLLRSMFDLFSFYIYAIVMLLLSARIMIFVHTY
jgi:hypothetical protein